MDTTPGLLLRDAPEWQDRAGCREPTAADLFIRTLSGSRREVAAAIAICRRCPVRIECGDHADTSDQRAGVWGGMDRDVKGL